MCIARAQSFGSDSEGFLSTQRAVVEGLQEVAARPARTQSVFHGILYHVLYVQVSVCRTTGLT